MERMNSIKNSFNIFLLIFILLLANVNTSCSQEMLTWKECVLEAKNNHPDLISAKEKVKQSRSDKDIAIGAMLPQLTSDAEGKRAKTASQSKESNTYSYGLSGKQLAFDGFQTASSVGSATKTISAEQYNYAVASSNIRLNLKTAFTSLLRAQELITLTEDIAQRREQNLELVQLRYEAGREHKGALLTAQADLAQANFEVAQAERNLSLAQRQLTKELGREKFSHVKLEGGFNIDEIDPEKPDLENLAENTPFIKELIAKKDAARLDYASAQSDFFPKVYLETSYSDTASDSDWPIKSSRKAWAAGVSISFPIFEGATRIANTLKERSKWKQTQADERSGRDSVLVTLERTWKNLQDAIANVSVKKKFLEAAQERAKITKAQYETGLASFNDWIIIEDNFVNAKKSHLNTQADMLIAEAYWIQAIGRTLEYDEI